MSYFKKFCDLIGGIGATFAAVFLLGRYMEYNPSDAENKLKIFFSSENSKEYRQYVVFIVLLFAAVLLGRLFKKFPEITLFLSVLPLCQVMGMLWHKKLYEDPEFYVIVCLTVVAGNIYEAFLRSKESGSNVLHSAAVVVGAFGVVSSLLSVKFSSMAKAYSDAFVENELAEAEELVADRLSFIGADLISNVPENEIKTLAFVAAALAVCLAVSVICRVFVRKLYVLNLLLSAVPFFYVISALHTEKLNTSPMLVIVPVTVYFLCQAALVAKK